MRVYRGNIKSALKSTSRERQYVSRPGIVGHEILEQSASTERLKFIVHGVAIAGLASMCESRFYVITGARKMETACQIRAFPLHFACLNLTSVSSQAYHPRYLNIFHDRGTHMCAWARCALRNGVDCSTEVEVYVSIDLLSRGRMLHVISSANPL